MKAIEMNRIKEVGKKTISEFVRSETGSVGVKNAVAIGAFAAAFAISQTVSEAVTISTTQTIFGVVITAI